MGQRRLKALNNAKSRLKVLNNVKWLKALNTYDYYTIYKLYVSKFTIILYKSKLHFSYHSSWSWYLGVVQDPNSRAIRICR